MPLKSLFWRVSKTVTTNNNNDQKRRQQNILHIHNRSCLIFFRKTTLARKLYDELGGDENVSYLVHDSYYKDLSHLLYEERIQTNFDHPHSLETSMLIEHIQSLKAGTSVRVPCYDFTTHSRRLNECTTVIPRKIIIIEGILILCQPELVKEMDIKVFVVRVVSFLLKQVSILAQPKRKRSLNPIYEVLVTVI